MFENRIVSQRALSRALVLAFAFAPSVSAPVDAASRLRPNQSLSEASRGISAADSDGLRLISLNEIDKTVDALTAGKTPMFVTRVFAADAQVDIAESRLLTLERRSARFDPTIRSVRINGMIGDQAVLEELRAFEVGPRSYVVRDVYLDANSGMELIGRNIPALLEQKDPDGETIAADGSAKAQATAAPAISVVHGRSDCGPGAQDGVVRIYNCSPSHCGTSFDGWRAVDSIDPWGATSEFYYWIIQGSGFGTTPGSVSLAGYPARIESWSSTSIKVWPRVPYSWGGFCASLTVSTPYGTSYYGVTGAPAIKGRLYGQCTWHVAKARYDRLLQPSTTAYGSYTSIGVSYAPRVGDQYKFASDTHTAIVVSVAGPYRDGTWTRWNIQVSEQNYDCHNSTRTYWTFTDNNGSYVVHYPGHPSLGVSTTYYR